VTTKPTTHYWAYIVTGALWLVAVGLGMAALLNYSNTPSRDRLAPERWPAQSTIPRVAGQATLVMFTHPRCACTRASVGELAELMAHCQKLVGAHVVFFRPSGSVEDWAHSDLWRAVELIPGVTVQSDEDGREARLFHADTSGHTVLYDAQGQLVFNGGITISRGHSGDNAGRDAIMAFLHAKTMDRAQTPVFGCLILDPSSKPANGDRPCTP